MESGSGYQEMMRAVRDNYRNGFADMVYLPLVHAPMPKEVAYIARNIERQIGFDSFQDMEAHPSLRQLTAVPEKAYAWSKAVLRAQEKLRQFSPRTPTEEDLLFFFRHAPTWPVRDKCAPLTTAVIDEVYLENVVFQERDGFTLGSAVINDTEDERRNAVFVFGAPEYATRALCPEEARTVQRAAAFSTYSTELFSVPWKHARKIGQKFSVAPPHYVLCGLQKNNHDDDEQGDLPRVDPPVRPLEPALVG